MVTFASTKVSSKGQVVIPENVRRLQRIEAGDRYMVIPIGNDLLFRQMPEPDIEEFEALAAKVRAAARKAGIKPADVKEAIKKVRARKRARG